MGYKSALLRVFPPFLDQVTPGSTPAPRRVLVLQREIGTTDYTDYTDLEYVMSSCPLTQKVNFLTDISNPILSVKSVKSV